MESATEMDKIIARIQKLFARSGRDGSTRGASEAEAETAMRLAQELMVKHNLDMATIEARGRSVDDAAQVRVKEALAGKTRFAWQRQLAKYVAEAHFCYHLIKEDREWDEGARGGRGGWRTSKTHVFVGRKGNVITAQLMYAYLTQAVEDCAPEDDSRVEIGRIYSADHGYDHHDIKALEDGTFKMVGGPRTGELFESLSAAARAINNGTSTNGYLFWGLGAASTAVSFKEGMADRLCERLAQRRSDLVAAHDARVRAEEEARAAEREAAVRESAAKAARVLGAPPPSDDEILELLRGKARFAPQAPTGQRIVRPEASDADDVWAPGAGAEPECAPAQSTALVLASVYDESEREANEEMARGYEPGTFARWRREREAWKREAERVAERVDQIPDEEWKPGEAAKPETPAQEARRKAREAKEYAKRRERWAREDARAARKAEKEYARKDHRAYRAGVEAGDEVGLDPQVKERAEQKRLAESVARVSIVTAYSPDNPSNRPASRHIAQPPDDSGWGETLCGRKYSPDNDGGSFDNINAASRRLGGLLCQTCFLAADAK